MKISKNAIGHCRLEGPARFHSGEFIIMRFDNDHIEVIEPIDVFCEQIAFKAFDIYFRYERNAVRNFHESLGHSDYWNTFIGSYCFSRPTHSIIQYSHKSWMPSIELLEQPLFPCYPTRSGEAFPDSQVLVRSL